MSRSVGRLGWDVQDTDVLVKVSAADTTANYLNPKINAGTGITTSILNPGANEQLDIAVTAGAYISGSGTNGTVPKFTAATVIGDSIITESGAVITVTGNQIITGLTNNRLLSSNGSNQLTSVANLASWVAGGTDISIVDDGDGSITVNYTGGASISGSGTTTYIPKFTGATAIGDSIMSDNGSGRITVNSGDLKVDNFFAVGTNPSSGVLGNFYKFDWNQDFNIFGVSIQNRKTGISNDAEFTGLANNTQVNVGGGGQTGVTHGFWNQYVLQDGDIGSVGTPRDAHAFKNILDINATDPAHGNVYSQYDVATQVAGHTIGGDYYAHRYNIALSGTVTGTKYGIYFDANSLAWDLYSNGNVYIGTSLRLNGATATRLLQTDGSKDVVSVANLANWIAGGTDISVVDDGDGTVTVNYTGGSGISGSGTTDTLAKFTGATAIGDSLVSESGTVVSVTGTLAVSGVGPHAFGGATDGHNRFWIRGDFTSDGGSTNVKSFYVSSTLTGANGDTLYQTGTLLATRITTQNNSEVIGDISQLRLDEPHISLGTDTATNASTLHITGAPTEGVSNWAILVDSGAVKLGGTLNLDTATATRLLQTDGSKNAISVANLASWIAGGTDISVVDDGDGTVTVNYTGSAITGTGTQYYVPRFATASTLGDSFLLDHPTTGFDQAIINNSATAHIIRDGLNNYFNIITTTGSAQIAFGNTSTNPKYDFRGSGVFEIDSLSASQAVFTNGSKQLVSNAITGTGNVVMSASPTLTGTVNVAAITASGNITASNTTASRLLSTSAGKVLTSVANLASWIAGGTDISVVDDGDGTVTVNYTGSGGSAETDEQTVQASSEQTRTSTSMADLDSMTLTTSNTASKKYLCVFTCESSHEFEEGETDFRFHVDGAAVTATQQTVTHGLGGPACFSFHYLTGSLATGKVIKVQWASDGDESLVHQRRLTIFGVS